MINKFIFLFPLLFPSYLVKFSLPIGGSINLLDILLLTFILVYALNIFKNKKFHWANFVTENGKLLTLLSFFIFGLFLSFANNASAENWINGLGIIKSFYLLPIIFAVIVGFYFSQNKSFLEYFLAGYFSYASCLAIIGAFYLLGHKLTFDNRLAIFFQSPNQLAIALAPGIIIGFAIISSLLQKNRSLAILAALITLAQFCILLQTQSLGAIIGLIFAAIFIAFEKVRNQIFLLTIALSIVSLFLIFNASFLLKIAGYAPNIPADAIDSRLAVYQADEKMQKNNFFWGIGPGNFQQTYLDYQKYFSPYPQWAVPHAHNLPTNIWLEAGIIGLLLFIAVVQLVYKKTPFRGNITIICLSILIYFLIHGLFDTTYWKNDLAIILWTVLVLSAIKLQLPAKNY